MRCFQFFIFYFLVMYSLNAQNGNSCVNSIEISTGSYFVDTIAGDSFSSNCTELDEDNGDLQL